MVALSFGAAAIHFAVIGEHFAESRPDGRMTEHWNQEIAIADPAARRVVGMADLSVYAHGGPGTYRLRYLGGDQILVEGAFTLVP